MNCSSRIYVSFRLQDTPPPQMEETAKRNSVSVEQNLSQVSQALSTPNIRLICTLHCDVVFCVPTIVELFCSRPNLACPVRLYQIRFIIEARWTRQAVRSVQNRINYLSAEPDTNKLSFLCFALKGHLVMEQTLLYVNKDIFH